MAIKKCNYGDCGRPLVNSTGPMCGPCQELALKDKAAADDAEKKGGSVVGTIYKVAGGAVGEFVIEHIDEIAEAIGTIVGCVELPKGTRVREAVNVIEDGRVFVVFSLEDGAEKYGHYATPVDEVPDSAAQEAARKLVKGHIKPASPNKD